LDINQILLQNIFVQQLMIDLMGTDLFLGGSIRSLAKILVLRW